MHKKTTPEMDYLIHDIINKTNLVVALLIEGNDRDAAVKLNSGVTFPITNLRRQFGMASGNVVKVKTPK
jgi:hypothetical protein